MAVVNVQNLDGQVVGQVELADSVFAAGVNPHLLHEAVRWQLASQRAGTHKTKGRGEVAGSGRKLWRQKGTGRARVGSIRSSIWRKGGTVHGPQPHSYGYHLPRKVLLGALRSALSSKLADAKLTVVEGWTLPSHKTKEFRQTLSRLDDQTRTILVVEEAGNHNLELASRNLVGVRVISPRALGPYDVLRHERLMLSKEAALRLGRSLGTGEEGAAGEAKAQPEAAAEPPAEQAKPAAAKKASRPRTAGKSAAKSKAPETKGKKS